MLVWEVSDASTAKLAALSQFLLGRSKDTGSKLSISTDTFVKLARNMGIALTPEKLQQLIQSPPLNGIIAAVEPDRVIFQGQQATEPDMPVDRARDIVSGMAKNVAKQSFQE